MSKQVKKKLAKVKHFDLYGTRAEKFGFLQEKELESIKWKKLKCIESYYFFVPKDFRSVKEYEKGFGVDELFVKFVSGIKTHSDNTLVSFVPFGESEKNEKYLYRPFDVRYIDYDLNKVIRHRFSIMQHILGHDNTSIITSKQFGGYKHFILYISKHLHDISSQPFAAYYNFPLYLYSENGTKTPNFNQEIFSQLIDKIGKITPEELFDYIYAILHSPTYRERYKEFLKIDFPRIPYPTDKKLFKKLVKIGGKLRELHLMESEKLDKLITSYPEMGSDAVEQVKYVSNTSKKRGKAGKSVKKSKAEKKPANLGRVYINDKQYFGGVPELAWEFYIGGYQPAQKWLKDRKKASRTLSNDDIEHYQRIIVALVGTDNLMQKVDEAVGTWPMK